MRASSQPHAQPSSANVTACHRSFPPPITQPPNRDSALAVFNSPRPSPAFSLSLSIRPRLPPRRTLFIMGRTHGMRRGTRYMFAQSFRKHGPFTMKTWFTNYKVGDIVDIKVNPLAPELLSPSSSVSPPLPRPAGHHGIVSTEAISTQLSHARRSRRSPRHEAWEWPRTVGELPPRRGPPDGLNGALAWRRAPRADRYMRIAGG